MLAVVLAPSTKLVRLVQVLRFVGNLVHVQQSIAIVSRPVAEPVALLEEPFFPHQFGAFPGKLEVFVSAKCFESQTEEKDAAGGAMAPVDEPVARRAVVGGGEVPGWVELRGQVVNGGSDEVTESCCGQVLCGLWRQGPQNE